MPIISIAKTTAAISIIMFLAAVLGARQVGESVQERRQQQQAGTGAGARPTFAGVTIYFTYYHGSVFFFLLNFDMFSPYVVDVLEGHPLITSRMSPLISIATESNERMVPPGEGRGRGGECITSTYGFRF